MENFIHALQAKMVKPTLFGWYHILWIIITLGACVLIYIFRKKISKKAVNIVLLVFSISLILFEAYKLIILSFNYNGGSGASIWHFSWNNFPFQFCSTPMYLMLLAGILRKGKVYDALLCYLASFAFFAGLTVLAYPAGVFSTLIGITIHTMYWHCGMIIIGFLILATKSIKLNYKSFLKASIVFIIMVAIAMIMNLTFHAIKPNENFNMFYISPYFRCTLPLLGDIIYPNVPYPVFLIIYILGFVLIACIILSIAIGIDKLIEKHKQKQKSNKQKTTMP